MFIELAVMTMTFFTGMVLIILNPLKRTRPLGWLLLQALGRTYIGLGLPEMMLLVATWMLYVISHEKFQGAHAGEDFLLQPCTRIGDGLYTLVVSGCLIFHLL